MGFGKGHIHGWHAECSAGRGIKWFLWNEAHQSIEKPAPVGLVSASGPAILLRSGVDDYRRLVYRAGEDLRQWRACVGLSAVENAGLRLESAHWLQKPWQLMSDMPHRLRKVDMLPGHTDVGEVGR